MPNYEIKINIDIKKTDKLPSNTINKVPDGSFGIVIPHEVAKSIDQSEKALLTVNYPAIREALSGTSASIYRQRLIS